MWVSWAGIILSAIKYVMTILSGIGSVFLTFLISRKGIIPILPFPIAAKWALPPADILQAKMLEVYVEPVRAKKGPVPISSDNKIGSCLQEKGNMGVVEEDSTT